MAIEITETKTLACKNCGSEAIVKFGKYRDSQLYWCKSCKRKFKADAGAFHGKVPANYVSSAVDMYYRGMSFKDISDHLNQEYGYRPSKSVLFKWVNKYTDIARAQFKDVHPEVGDRWIADETMLDVDGQHKIWFYDVIDERTRVLLASRPAISRTTGDAELVMREAAKRAGKKPKVVITDSNNSYMDGIGEAFGAKTEHEIGHPFEAKETGLSTSEIERFHGTLKDRTKVMRAFRDMETLIQFTDGWLVYYNYFKPHQSLGGKTPAEEAHVQYPVKNWADLVRLPVSKQSEIQTHKAPTPKFSRPKVNLDRAFKRHRQPKISQTMPPITPKVG